MVTKVEKFRSNTNVMLGRNDDKLMMNVNESVYDKVYDKAETRRSGGNRMNRQKRMRQPFLDFTLIYNFFFIAYFLCVFTEQVLRYYNI